MKLSKEELKVLKMAKGKQLSAEWDSIYKTFQNVNYSGFLK